MNPREENLVRTMTTATWKFYVWIVFLSAVLLLGLGIYVVQLRRGLIITGLRDQVSWGLYIATFVFWVGVSKGGTMISAILRITNSSWRAPMTRMSEAITVLALLTGVPMIVADLGRPDRIWNLFRHGRIQSPLIWDLISVNTYLVACLIYYYLPLIPDLAILAKDERLAAWRRKLYRRLSLNWTGSAEQHALLEKAIGRMAIVVIPLAISVHTVVSWIFAMTLRPGWNSTIYGPYFVVGAIYSGCAAVILSMWILRRTFHLEGYVQPVHFRKLASLLLVGTLVYLYFNINEYLTVGYKLEGFERQLVESLFIGQYARLFWTVQLLGVILPIVILILTLTMKSLRRFTVQTVGTASLLIVLGAWAKRFLIVVPTLQTPFLPAQRIPAEWTQYRPTWQEWSVVAGAVAGFFLAYSLLTKLFPIVSIWETREHPGTEETSEKSPAPNTLRPASVASAILLAFLVLTPTAIHAATAKKEPKVSAMAMDAKIVEPPPDSSPASQDRNTAAIPGTIRTLENPFASRPVRGVDAQPVPAILVSATLRDASGAAIPFKPLSFSVKTAFGSLLLGNRPTNQNGVATMKITDRRFGAYTVQAKFAGDEDFTASETTIEVKAVERPQPALPEVGMLITPYPTFWITVPFVLLFGAVWLVFGNVAYLVFWRMRRVPS